MHARRIGLIVTFAFLASSHLSCAVFQSHDERTEYSARLNDGTHCELVQEIRRDALRTGPKRNYAALHLRLCPNNRVILDADAGRSEGRFAESPHFDFGALEGRSDATQSKLWIVERDKHRILASLDRNAETCTGLHDSAPPWATVDGGILLATNPQ